MQSPSPPTIVQKYKLVEIVVPIESCTTETSQKNVAIIKTLCELFQPYMQNSGMSRLSVVLVDKPREHGSLYLNEQDRIEIPEIIMNDPAFENEELLKLFHDLVHVTEKAMRQSEASQSIATIEEAYAYLVRQAGYNSMKNKLHFSKKIEYNPYFRIFDESSYTPPFHFSPYGHPYGSASELFASVLTIFRFFPHEFVSRFRTLNRNAQKTIQYVTEEIFNALLFYNTNPDALKKLIPEYEMIVREISS